MKVEMTPEIKALVDRIVGIQEDKEKKWLEITELGRQAREAETQLAQELKGQTGIEPGVYLRRRELGGKSGSRSVHYRVDAVSASIQNWKSSKDSVLLAVTMRRVSNTGRDLNMHPVGELLSDLDGLEIVMFQE